MKSVARTSLIVCLLTVATVVWSAGSYEIDKAHSSIGFKIRHMGLSSVSGRFTDFSGTIVHNDKDITQSSASVTIKAASINTDNQKRDDHLRAADFFDVARYPDITFVSKSVSKKGDGYLLVGTLTMHGVSKDVSIPFATSGPVTDPSGVVRAGAEGSTTLNRLDFKIGDSKMLNSSTLLIGDEVKVDLMIEGVGK